MATFRFRLDPVLRVRRAQMQSAKSVLSDYLREDESLREALADTAANRTLASQELQGGREAHTLELRALSGYLVHLQLRAADLKRSVEKVAALIHDQQKRVADLHQAERLLMKLREEKYLEWEHAEASEIEQIGLEAWMAAHARKAKPYEDE